MSPSMRHHTYYVLEGHEVKQPADVLEWGRYFEKADRHVAKTDVGPFWVSTVFLGIDHQFGEGPPLLFETMVFRNDPDGTRNMSDLWSDRASTWEEAELTHAWGVAWAQKQLEGVEG